MPRALVILTTSTYRAADFVEAARLLGVDLAIASDDAPPLGAVDDFVLIDCRDVTDAAERVADLAVRTPVDAIVAADDRGVAIAALASSIIGLPHNPPAAAAATLDKLALRRALDEHEVPQPAYTALRPGEDPRQAADAIGFPLVIKPTSLAAGQGVIRVDDPGSLVETVERVRDIGASAGAGREAALVMERFIPGAEVAVDGLVWGEEVEILAIIDKPDPLDGPYFEETMFVTPSRHPPDVLAEVEVATTRAVGALGLAHGPFHAELRLGPDGPVVIEVAARTIGGLCGRAFHFGLMRTPLEALVLRQALGIRLRLPKPPGASGALMVPIPRSGTLRAINGADAARAVPHVTGLEWTTHPGSRIEALPEGGRYLGFVFAEAPSPDAVESALRNAHAALDIVID